MARAANPVQRMVRQIDDLTEEQRCELLEAILLRERRAELGWEQIAGIRARQPQRSERQVARDVETAVKQVRREHP